MPQIQNPPSAQLNTLVKVFQSGEMMQTVRICEKMLAVYPGAVVVMNIMGAAYQALGQPEAAATAFGQAVSLKPDYAEAICNRAIALTALDRKDEAVACYDQAIALNPQFAEAHNNRGLLLFERNDLQEAVESFQKAAAARPGYGDPWNNMAIAQIMLGQFEAAKQSCDRAISIAPDQAEPYNLRGMALNKLGRIQEALGDYQQAIQLKPDFAAAYTNMGSAYNDAQSHEKAVDIFDRALALTPNSAETWYNLGIARQGLGERKPALECYDKALALKPDYADALSNRGTVLYELGLVDQAGESYDRAIALNPSLAPAYNNRGNARSNLGDREGAIEDFQTALRVDPGLAAAHRGLSHIKSYKPGDGQIDEMARLYNASAPDSRDRAHLCFGLAKAYDDTGEYALSFKRLSEGNRLRKAHLDYHVASDQQLFDRIHRVAEISVPENQVPTDRPSRRYIFIVGMPRSGTSLVEQILASHSRVYGAGELDTASDLLKPLFLEAPNAGHIPSPDFAQAVAILRDGYEAGLSHRHFNETVVTDKMPLNFRWTGFLLTAFPEAVVVHLERDPMAVCWSNYKHYFSGTGNGFAYDLADLARYYTAYKALMAFWRKRFPDRIYDLNYERLTESQEPETRRLLNFCGLDWEAGCLEFHRTRRAVQTASSIQVRRKMYQGSSRAWRRYQKELAPLISALGPCADSQDPV
ncbi:MAG: tetratricopeptide repeat protein [Desulfobacterales bacterium]|nr:tetratricopeptide repeat protein [Desulfobacterales bacterium]